MRLNRKEIITGRPIKAVRDFLRANRDARLDVDTVADFFETDSGIANTIISHLAERGLIAKATPEKWDQRPLVFTVTNLGIRFAAASLLKPIPRQKADQIISDLLARVEDINAHDELTHFVGEVRAFGSYITAAPEVGDIDLAISFVAKPPPSGMKLTQWHLERARRSGRTFSSYIDELSYSQNEVRRLVKDRNRYISIHSMSELDQLKAESRTLYKSPDRPVHHFPSHEAD